jgi:hypothetical protein
LSISATLGSAFFFDYTINKTTNSRAGTIIVTYNGSMVEFAEFGTVDLGNTNEVLLSVDISGGNIRLLATTSTNDWIIKSMIRII